jgi:hypothetical protein
MTPKKFLDCALTSLLFDFDRRLFLVMTPCLHLPELPHVRCQMIILVNSNGMAPTIKCLLRPACSLQPERHFSCCQFSGGWFYISRSCQQWLKFSANGTAIGAGARSRICWTRSIASTDTWLYRDVWQEWHRHHRQWSPSLKF